MNTRHVVSLGSIIAFVIMAPGISNGQGGKPVSGLVTLKANCTTSPTGGDGRRHACDSPWQEYKAPGDFVIAERGLTVRETSGNGSEHGCPHHFDGYVEVIPGTGIKQPTIFRLRAHARSPKGHWAGRGWAFCEANFVQVEVPRYTAEEVAKMKIPPVSDDDDTPPDLTGISVEEAKAEVEESFERN